MRDAYRPCQVQDCFYNSLDAGPHRAVAHFWDTDHTGLKRQQSRTIRPKRQGRTRIQSSQRKAIDSAMSGTVGSMNGDVVENDVIANTPDGLQDRCPDLSGGAGQCCAPERI